MRKNIFIGSLILMLFLPMCLQAQPTASEEMNGEKLHRQQEKENHLVVREIYEVLQDKSATLKEIAALVPGITREKKTPENFNNRYRINLSAIIENRWNSILFEDLKFETPTANSVLVTGTVKGRQPTECELISNQFQHAWSLKNSAIISFSELAHGP